mgnify:CR=1 FL=1
MQTVLEDISTNTGIALHLNIDPAVAIHVYPVVITSSPGVIPIAFRAITKRQNH